MKRRICIAQVPYRPGSAHIERLKNIISEHRRADLIVFPELILHGHPSPEAPEGLLYRRVKALYDYRKTSLDLYQFVKEAGARVIIGEMARRGDGYFNLATYVDGKRTESYAKTHVHWTERFVPGRELKTFETPMGRVGVTICFDGAFPEVWRVLALRGARTIVNISAVPNDFPVDYMRRRLAGAALDNQVFVIYANRPGEFFSGHSAVFSPTGEILASAGAEEAVFEAEMDMKDLHRWRKQEMHYPFRRPALYKEIIRNITP